MMWEKEERGRREDSWELSSNVSGWLEGPGLGSVQLCRRLCFPSGSFISALLSHLLARGASL